MTNGECICRETVDYMSRIALEKEDFRRLSVIWEFRVSGNWVATLTVKTIFTVPIFFPHNFIHFSLSMVISLIPHQAMISSACHGTKKRLQISFFHIMTLISDNKNRFCSNDLPAEGTSNPAYIQRLVLANTWIFLFLRS